MYVTPRPDRTAAPREVAILHWLHSDAGRRFTRGAVTVAIAYVVLSVALVGGALVVSQLFPVVKWDDAVSSWFAARRTPGWDSVSRAGTTVANTLGVVAIASVVTVIAAVRHLGRVAVLLVVGLALELALFLTVNYAVARPRPDAPHLGSTPSTFSFPSGHAAATLVLYGGIAVLVASRTRSPWARLAACLVALVLTSWVAFSRLYSAQHHPTDVLAGLVMGVGALGAAVLAVRPRWLPAEPEEGAT